MERLRLEGWAVAGNEKPVSDGAAQQLDGAEGWELAAEFWISGVRALRKNKPDAVVARRFGRVPQHADEVVAEVDAEAGKHAAHLGVQGHERVQDERMRRFLFGFGWARHGRCGLQERKIADQTKGRIGHSGSPPFEQETLEGWGTPSSWRSKTWCTDRCGCYPEIGGQSAGR